MIQQNRVRNLGVRSFAHSLFRSKSLKSKSVCERFAPVALYKRATLSNSLRLLMTKERREQFALFHKRITLLLTKTSESLKQLMSLFPTLSKNNLAKCVFVVVDHADTVFVIISVTLIRSMLSIEKGLKQKARQRRLFRGQNLFDSLPCLLTCCFASVVLKETVEFNRLFQTDRGKTACSARN